MTISTHFWNAGAPSPAAGLLGSSGAGGLVASRSFSHCGAIVAFCTESPPFPSLLRILS